jgi:O-acetyl-ADP-ribose deacetylase (regulator of RNase III)
MKEQIKLKNTLISIVKDDLTLLDVDAFVFYARTDLSLGSGYGNAIATRGGLSIKKELEGIGAAQMSQAIVTSAGELNAGHIIHAVGPGFQEKDIEKKLEQTILNSLRTAAEKNFKRIAFPIMGAGFYGIAPEKAIKIMYAAVKDYSSNSFDFDEIIFCGNDNREFRLLAEQKALLN